MPARGQRMWTGQLCPRCLPATPAHLLALVVAGGQVVDMVPAKGANLISHVRRKVCGLWHILQAAGKVYSGRAG